MTVTQTEIAGYGASIVWNRPAPEAIEALQQSGIATKLLDGLKDRDAIRERMREILLAGPRLGRNPLDVAADLKRELGAHLDSTLARMRNIARTEVLDAYRDGSREVERANRDVLNGWLWMSTLGQNTCPSCISLHGQHFATDYPGPQDHPQGACYRMPETKSWRDLGFDIDEPESPLPDKEKWFSSLSEQQQRRILGGKYYDAWVSGGYPMDRWAVQKFNSSWRDYFTQRKLPSDTPHSTVAAKPTPRRAATPKRTPTPASPPKVSADMDRDELLDILSTAKSVVQTGDAEQVDGLLYDLAKRLFADTRGISAEDIVRALEDYTTTDYADIRVAQVGSAYYKAQQALSALIDRMPKYSGTIYRGTDDLGGLIDQLRPGETFVESGRITSWSRSRQVANTFAGDAYASRRVIWSVQNESGAPIEMFSVLDYEMEVLTNHTRYLVLRKYEENGYIRIDLQEI